MNMEKTADEKVLALSWNIATEPKLYRQLAPNPYSSQSLQIISERFPGSDMADVARAVVLAEPEGKYDKDFKRLPYQIQKTVLYQQAGVTSDINRRLTGYYSQHVSELAGLTEGLIYDILFKTAFGKTNLHEVEQVYARSQRKNVKLLILSLLSEAKSLQLIDQPESQKQVSIEVSLPNQNSVPIMQSVVPKSNIAFPRIVMGVLFSISCLFLFFVFLDKPIVQGQTKSTAFSQKTIQQALPIEVPKKGRSFPTRLKIPSIGVDAAVEYVGLTSGGNMDVPENINDAGWYELGPIPGETGSAVISGHFDGRFGESGVFNNLDKLKQGDKIYVINDLGATTTFVIRESRTYNPGYADEVFLPNDNGVHLNLITCDGTWDEAKKSYSKRLVVFAEMP